MLYLKGNFGEKCEKFLYILNMVFKSCNMLLFNNHSSSVLICYHSKMLKPNDIHGIFCMYLYPGFFYPPP